MNLGIASTGDAARGSGDGSSPHHRGGRGMHHLHGL